MGYRAFIPGCTPQSLIRRFDRFRYAYDRASNRTWRENYEARQQSEALDEFYTYDALDRLTNMDRGTLSGTHPNYSAPASPAAEEDWTLSQTGNWSGYVRKTGGNTDLNQSREHNPVNEIADTSGDSDAITESTGPSWIDPAHDPAGNMTTAPRPGRGAETDAEETALTLLYDGWNRPAAAKIGETGVGRYEYDPASPRLRRAKRPEPPREEARGQRVAGRPRRRGRLPALFLQ